MLLLLCKEWIRGNTVTLQIRLMTADRKHSNTIRRPSPYTMQEKKEEKIQVSHAPLVHPRSIKPAMQVRLTPREEEICNLLVNVAKHLKIVKPDSNSITLRIAGGWVRDKLLGKECNDIDVAVDHLPGYDFAQQVNEYLHKQGHAIESLGKISANPDKSKHLETATGKILGHDIDFVNLRQEDYAHDSRIPSVRLGTPQEDALRRDITINSLFYNLHTRQVEDFTGHGLTDLANGRIRTPLPPKQTFLDDPLRVLRVIRFASRYSYDMLEDIAEAIQDSEIRQALERKVSNERIGIEVEKMFKSHDPLQAMRYIVQFGLYDIVFAPPIGVAVESDQDALRFTESLQWLLHPVTKLPTTLQRLKIDLDDLSIFCLHLSAATLPYADKTYREKTRDYPVARFLVRDSLKRSALDAEYVVVLHQHSKTLAQMAHHETESSRVNLAWMARRMGDKPLHAQWPSIFFLSMAKEFMSKDSLEVKRVVLDRYEELAKRIDTERLWDTWQWKPLIPVCITSGLSNC
jgi:tRNA nucleotidyltransferase (CCA-adding enzyme)